MRYAWQLHRNLEVEINLQVQQEEINGDFLEADLNEAALRRTLSRARRKRHRRFETRSLAEWSVSRYDEAIVSLSFLVSSMNSDSKIVPQTLCFSTTSKPKSIEIP